MKTLALYNIKGGVGKTTTAVNLAWLSARDGRRTLLWDLDPQGAATFTFRVKPKVKGGGKELLADPERLEASIKETDFRGLDLLPADFSYRNLDRILDRGGDADGRLRDVLVPLEAEYDRIFLDCPASISLLSENVFTAADALLVPTIPAVLSLRTLARLMKHLKDRKGRRPLVLPFFSMVDRRKRLHRDVCDYATREGLGFLMREIPYASVIEQMGVRRNPLGAYALGSAPSRACVELWREIGERLADERGAPSGKAVRSLLEAAESSTRARRRGSVPELERWRTMTKGQAETPDGRSEVEFKLRVRNEADFDSLARIVGEDGRSDRTDRTTIQENHFFDTGGGALRRAGFALRLRIEGARRVLTAKGPASRSERGMTERPEEEVELEPAEAERLLSGVGEPLALLAERIGSPRPRLLGFMASYVGSDPLRHVGSFRNVRRYLGPVSLGEAEVTFEMDRTELPGGRIDHEIEVEVAARDAARCRELLADLLARAGIPWATAPSKAQRFFEALAADERVEKA